MIGVLVKRVKCGVSPSKRDCECDKACKIDENLDT